LNVALTELLMYEDLVRSTCLLSFKVQTSNP